MHTHILSLVEAKENVLNNTFDQANDRSKFSVILWILAMLLDHCREYEGQNRGGCESRDDVYLAAWFVVPVLRRMAA